MDQKSALKETRIVDLSDEKSIYGAKLLADLGADVVRPEPPSGDPLRERGPHDGRSDISLWYEYYASSRRLIDINPDDEDELAILNSLIKCTDILILSPDNPFANSIDVPALKRQNQPLVVIECSAFGPSGPWKDFKAPELVAGALGGSVATTGDRDTPPLKTCGDLNFTISGAYTAIAALSGLYHARKTGEGQSVHVPVHECIASSLEHVFMWYFYHGFFPTARAQALERRGSLHWTDLYVVMHAKNGSIMITPTPNLDAQLAWLIEEDAFGDLLDPKYEERGMRREYFHRLMEQLHAWVAEKDVKDLFFQAQERHAPFGWVHGVEEVADNPQLHARKWWKDYELDQRVVQGPGVPVEFHATPATPKKSAWVSADSSAIIEEIGWETSK